MLVGACNRGWFAPLRLERISMSSTSAVGPSQHSILKGRFQLRSVTVESHTKEPFWNVPLVDGLTRSSPLKK